MPKVTQLIAGRIWYLKPDLSNPKSHALSPGLHSLSNKDLSSIYYVHTTALKHFGQVVLFDPPNYETHIIPFYKWRNQGSVGLPTLLKVIQLLSFGAGLEPGFV